MLQIDGKWSRAMPGGIYQLFLLETLIKFRAYSAIRALSFASWKCRIRAGKTSYYMLKNKSPTHLVDINCLQLLYKKV